MRVDRVVSRRDFLKAAATVGGSLVSSRLSIKEASSLPEARLIDGVLTYGFDTPLTQNEFQSLLVEWERKLANGEIEMRMDTQYTTEAVYPIDYTGIPPIMNESYQSFLFRHDQILDQIFKSAHPLLAGGAVTRRLEVLDNNVYSNPPKDSDGVEGIYFASPYIPTESFYYDPEKRIDRGRLHEKAHKIHAPDIYSLDFDPTSGSSLTNLPPEDIPLLIYESDSLAKFIPELRDPKILQQLKAESTQEVSIPALVDIPPEWQKYFVYNRNDARGRGLMNTLDYFLDSYTSWLFARRVREGWTHDLQRTIPEGSWDFANELSVKNTLVLGTEFNDAQVEIYRTNGDYLIKNLEGPILNGVVTDGIIEVGNPFAGVKLRGGRMIPSYQCVLFLKVKQAVDGNTSTSFRWLDIGDFSLGYWQNNRPYGMKLFMNLASGDMTQSQFNWAINYEPVEAPYKIYVPNIQNS